MKNWISKNYKTLIITAFLIPIITVAIVSISHVTSWYGISNPVTWAVYLSIGIEIAALSALAAISANMGSKVYFPFAIVTIVQFIGNIFFAYTYIDINSQMFKDWVDMVSPLVEFLGVEPNDFVGHKRFLALFAGGMLPVISLSFLHMLVKFTEEDKKKVSEVPKEETPTIEPTQINSSELVSEISRVRLTDQDLKKIEELLLTPVKKEETIKEEEKQVEEVIESSTPPKNTSEMMLTTNEDIINSIPPDDEFDEWLDANLLTNEEEEHWFPTPEEIETNNSTLEPIEDVKETEPIIEEEVYEDTFSEIVPPVDVAVDNEPELVIEQPPVVEEVILTTPTIQESMVEKKN